MKTVVLSTFHFLVMLCSGAINREQLQAIEFLQTECAVLRQLLGKKRLRLNDEQRRRLAVKGKSLGRSRLAELATIVTPDTILRWHRTLIARSLGNRLIEPGPSAGQAVGEIGCHERLGGLLKYYERKAA